MPPAGGACGRVVSPTSAGQISWDELVVTHPEFEAFARERWLGARRRLEVLPDSFTPTRAALHQVAFFVVSPARYGASPGDDAHPEPYLYVAAWGEIDRSDPYWNDTAFNGASLAYRRLLAADDQYATALAFLRRGHTRLVR